MHAWFVPTLERLVGIMNYPDKANEFASAKVTPEAARRTLQVLLNHMRMDMPPPRIVPTENGGILCEWKEYWVDCTLIVSPNGDPFVEMSTRGGASVDESASGCEPAERLLKRSFDLLLDLIRSKLYQPVPPPSSSHSKG